VYLTKKSQGEHMRKLTVLLTMLFAFTFLSMAQSGGAASTGQSSSGGGSQAGAGDKSSGQHATHKKGSGGGSTLTGCLSGPNQEGVYELKSGKRTVEVGGLDDLSKHVGHTVKLHGSWAKGSEIGEKEEGAEHKEGAAEGKSKSGGEEKGERHFKVASIDHVSDTCAAAGTDGHKKGSSDSSATPKK
jgi:hypothetical protein